MHSSKKILPYLFLLLLTDNQAWGMDRIKKCAATVKQIVLDRRRDKLHAKVFAAAENADITKLQELLGNPKVDINTKDTAGNTALHVVVRRQHAGCIDLLTDSKADVNAPNNVGDTPLHVAACSASPEIISKLVGKKALLAARNNFKETPLCLAITHGNDDAVEQLLVLGADPNQPSGNENSPPVCIAFRQHIPFRNLPYDYFPFIQDKKIESLLRAGARINIAGLYDLQCETHPQILRGVYVPLITAIESNDSATVKHCFDQGARHCLDFEELPRTAQRSLGDIHNAKYLLNVATNCTNPRPEMVRFLIDAGCLDGFGVGRNLVRNAFMYGHIEMAHLLISHMPRARIIRQWNKIALPLLVGLKRIQQLPEDLRKLICLYCVRSACVDEQVEHCYALFKTSKYVLGEEIYFTVYFNKTIVFEKLKSTHPASNQQYQEERNKQYLDAYEHILDNIPTWQMQINLAIKNKPKAQP